MVGMVSAPRRRRGSGVGGHPPVSGRFGQSAGRFEGVSGSSRARVRKQAAGKRVRYAVQLVTPQPCCREKPRRRELVRSRESHCPSLNSLGGASLASGSPSGIQSSVFKPLPPRRITLSLPFRLTLSRGCKDAAVRTRVHHQAPHCSRQSPPSPRPVSPARKLTAPLRSPLCKP